MKREEKPTQKTKFLILFFHYPKKKRKGESNNSNRNYGSLQHRIRHAQAFPTFLYYNFRGRGGLVVRSRLWGRRVPGSKPDSTEDPPCIGPVAR
ncbi:hypothetical protein AVEN_144231-1 [Araneus ventricosus]|uniref:Uncharacterized protein n=1 Tax=Araneus ventricosus TaxID=182803 RepID=A0A4Y2QW91_ARAVE|nr:hypothetical protein AVEN_186824-1 [Araneus ventricosus]GBN58248.1 hypothetical protein AVEN_251655-1 [Araneus ventricosus]GBN67581.1 hypothetical protein AVEN_165852-1 [Araneus ventricosus]GBN67614.1 hypothetical protein AVEN_144231-1 [Araneus ventricosus]